MPQPRDLVWAGDGLANAWDLGFTASWLNAGVPATFASGDNVTFDDTGSSSPAITLTNAISAGEMLVDASQDYTFGGSGSLTGPTVLLKEGSGKLTFNLLNTFNWGNPNGTFSSGQFGRITSMAGDPRIMQFGIKYGF